MPLDRVHQPRLTQARLADEQHDLAHALLGLLPAILEQADFIGSTTGLLKYTTNSPDKEYIVATESGIIHQMAKASPDKTFIPAPPNNSCACNDAPDNTSIDVAIHFIFPNNAFKYRQSGPYKVEGVKEMVQQIYKDHKRFSAVSSYLLSYALLQLTAYVALILIYYRQSFPLSALAMPLLLATVLLNPITGFVAANGFGTHSYLNVILVTAVALAAYYHDPLIPVASLLMACAWTCVCRKLGLARVPFNDMRNKKSPKYSEFFRRYCVAFKKVFTGTAAPVQQRSALSPDGLRASDALGQAASLRQAESHE